MNSDLSKNLKAPTKTRLGKRWAFGLVPVGAVFIFLAGLEFALSLAPPDSIGEGSILKLNPAGLPYFRVEKEGSRQVYSPSHYYLPWGHHFQFFMPKPRGVFRIFTLGGSTTKGYPFYDPGSFAKYLSVMFGAVDRQVTYEVINSGQYGFPACEAMSLEKQILKADPDLIIIYSGNNEFFHHRAQTGTVSLPGWMLELKYRLQEFMIVRMVQQLLGSNQNNEKVEYQIEPEAMRKHAAYHFHNVLDNNWDLENRDWVLSQYRSNLENMVAMAKSQGVRVILCTVPVNLRNFEPYGSYHPEDFNQSDLAEWSRLVQAGKKDFTRGDMSSARAHLKKAAAMDDTAATLNFHLGHTLLRLGEKEESYRYFQAAVDHDIVRSRTGSDLNKIIREVALSYDVPLADTVKTFRERAKDGVPGDDLFLDDLHPTLEGHRIIAKTILQCMVEEGWVKPEPRWKKMAEEAALDYENKIPAHYMFSSYYTAASLNAFLGRFERSRAWVNKGLQYVPNNNEGLELKYCLDVILKQRTSDPSLPWGEVEFARSYNSVP